MQLDALTRVRSIEPDLMFFKSPESISKMALGYNSFLADVYWIRAVQYYGRREEAQKRLFATATSRRCWMLPRRSIRTDQRLPLRQFSPV